MVLAHSIEHQQRVSSLPSHITSSWFSRKRQKAGHRTASQLFHVYSTLLSTNGIERCSSVLCFSSRLCLAGPLVADKRAQRILRAGFRLYDYTTVSLSRVISFENDKSASRHRSHFSFHISTKTSSLRTTAPRVQKNVPSNTRTVAKGLTKDPAVTFDSAQTILPQHDMNISS